MRHDDTVDPSARSREHPVGHGRAPHDDDDVAAGQPAADRGRDTATDDVSDAARDPRGGIDTSRRAFLVALVADAVAMPVHWY